MKFIALLFTVVLTACSVVPTQPVKLQEHARIGVVNLVGHETKNYYWGLTIFGNFQDNKAVDWGVREYITVGIKRRIESSSDYEVVIINDDSVTEAFRTPLLNSLNQFTRESKDNLFEVKKNYGLDILILVTEGAGYVGGNRYTRGYGIHGHINNGFIHANLRIYSIDLEKFDLFFPASLDGISTKPLSGATPVPILRYIDKQEKSFNVGERAERIIQKSIDGSLDWYFSLFPVDPPLRR